MAGMEKRWLRSAAAAAFATMEGLIHYSWPSRWMACNHKSSSTWRFHCRRLARKSAAYTQIATQTLIAVDATGELRPVQAADKSESPRARSEVFVSAIMTPGRPNNVIKLLHLGS